MSSATIRVRNFKNSYQRFCLAEVEKLSPGFIQLSDHHTLPYLLCRNFNRRFKSWVLSFASLDSEKFHVTVSILLSKVCINFQHHWSFKWKSSFILNATKRSFIHQNTDSPKCNLIISTIINLLLDTTWPSDRYSWIVPFE